MNASFRQLAPPLALLSAAALALPLAAPGVASASASDRAGRSALRADREQLRVNRAEERAAHAEERRAAHEREGAERKATREQERDARRSSRAQERAARRSARGKPADEAPAEEAAGGETGTAPAQGEPATPSDTAADPRCRATIESSSSLITAGETVTIFGKLTCPAGTTSADRQLTIDEDRHDGGASAFSALGVSTTEADGSYKLSSPALDANTSFRVRVGHRAARVVVKVAPIVTLTGPSPAAKLSTVGGRPFAAHPARVTFTGTVDPAQQGARVALQVSYAATGEQWRTVSFGAVGEEGTYAVTHGFRTAGQASVRVLVHMPGRNVVAASEPLTYEVAQVQNPLLTIRSSAAPLTYGEPVTISGVAAGQANQTVTLLAHTHGARFAPVTSTTTDGGGNYSFTQAPSQSTSYRVIHGTTQSTVLFEAVRRALTLDPVPSAFTAGQQISFTGAVTPADEGQLVYAERENASGVGFHVVASATIGASGFTITRAFTNTGSYSMRIRVPGDATFQATTSARFTFEVTSAPAAELTPETPTSLPGGTA